METLLRNIQVECYGPVVPLDSSCGGVCDFAGNTHLKLNKFKEAVESYGKAIDLDPTNATYFCNR